jgi:anti-anti-sigma regulatory factor
MVIKMGSANTETILKFDGSQTIRGAEEIHRRLQEALRDHESVVVDCAQIENADLVFLQMLLSARLTALDAGKSIRLAAPAEGPLLEALTRAGFAPAGEILTAERQFWLGGGCA